MQTTEKNGRLKINGAHLEIGDGVTTLVLTKSAAKELLEYLPAFISKMPTECLVCGHLAMPDDLKCDECGHDFNPPNVQAQAQTPGKDVERKNDNEKS